jgi:hypothetical protein
MTGGNSTAGPELARFNNRSGTGGLQSMSGNQSDSGVVQIIDAAAPATIDEVVSLMQQIDDALDTSDGLKWFNLLYLMVTREIGNHRPANGWAAPAWVTRLDVVLPVSISRQSQIRWAIAARCRVPGRRYSRRGSGPG